LPRLPKKLRVVAGWTLDLLFSRAGADAHNARP